MNNKFQFLIGSLKTEEFVEEKATSTVSIPHR